MNESMRQDRKSTPVISEGNKMYRKENAQIYTMKQALKHNERLLKEVKLKTKQNKTLEKVHHLSFCYLKIYLDNSTGEVIHALKRKRPCSVAQFSCLEHCPVNRKVGSSIPSQGTYKRQPINVSLSLSLSRKTSVSHTFSKGPVFSLLFLVMCYM